jgi:integrase/recombinase XerD
MKSFSPQNFNHNYQSHLKHLKLKGLQPKTIEAYSRTIRRLGAYFNEQIDALTEPQLADYFSDLLASHSWSSVKLDLYGLKFYTTHVLQKPWIAPRLIRPPRVQRLPDIVSVKEAGLLFAATHTLSYKVFFFTLYSLGLRLGEGLRLQVGDIDAARCRVHIRDAKGNKDRLVPLPNRHGGLAAAGRAVTPLDRSGVQAALRQVASQCGLKKRSPRTACATAMPPT